MAVADPQTPQQPQTLAPGSDVTSLMPGADVTGLMSGSHAPPPNLTTPSSPVAQGAMSFVSSFNPLPLLKLMASHPDDPIGAIGSQVIAQSKARLDAAKASIDQGDTEGAAAHFVGAIPVIGPIIDDLHTAVKNGDAAGAARAVGSAAALVAPTALAGGADLAAEAAAPKIAEAASARANANVADALGPQNGWGRSTQGKMNAAQAEKIAPKLVAAGLPTTVSDTGFDTFVDTGFQNASNAWDAAEQARLQGRPIPTAPIIANIRQRMADLTPQPVQGSLPQRTPVTATSPILGPNGQPVQTTTMQAQPIGQATPGPNVAPQLAVMQKAIDNLQQLGPVTTYDELRKFRQDADLGAKYRSSALAPNDQNIAAQQSAQGNQIVAGETRDAMAALEPGLAQANGQFALWKSASDLRDAADEINRSAPKGGSFAVVSKMMPAIMGMSGGAAIGGETGAAIGGFLGTVLKVAKDSGYSTQVLTAKYLSNLADAVKTGNAPLLFRSVAAIGAATGTALPVLDQSIQMPAQPMVTTGQPINVAIAQPRGGG